MSGTTSDGSPTADVTFGSVCTDDAAALQLLGLCYGVVTSPFFLETRIQCKGTKYSRFGRILYQPHITFYDLLQKPIES